MSITSEQFWLSAAVTVVIDIALILLLLWRLKPARFRRLKWALVGSSMLLWTGYAAFLLSYFWESYYRFLFREPWQVAVLISSVPFLYGFFAWSFHWLSLRTRLNPILIFCLLGGLESIFEHLWGMYGLGLTQVPMLRQASPLSLFAFAIPEYVLYWCVVIALAALAQTIFRLLPLGKQVLPANPP